MAKGVMFYVCEVKSITVSNEERQLRMAIGQLTRYRQKLAAQGHEPITSVIAAERQPFDLSWQDLCDHEGILLSGGTDLRHRETPQALKYGYWRANRHYGGSNIF